jgi:translation elongation factor P/translation initiation factor 5A
MVAASQLRPGTAIRFQGQPYKIISVDYHPGQGKMGGVAHARLQNLDTGTFWEHSFRSEMKLDEISLDRRPLEFLYADADHCCFMDPQSYEQTEIENQIVGERASFLEAGMKLSVEFVEGRAGGGAVPGRPRGQDRGYRSAPASAGGQRVQACLVAQRSGGDGAAVREDRRPDPPGSREQEIHGPRPGGIQGKRVGHGRKPPYSL